MIWPFRRKPRPQPPAPPAGDSPEEWCVGDTAECIAGPGSWRNSFGWLSNGPEHGEVRIVADISLGADQLVYLGFSRWRGHFFAATCFRKITPRADEAKRGTVARLSDLLSAAVRETEDA